MRALPDLGCGPRTVAMLGYLAELGSFEREGHAGVGRLAVELGVDRVVVVGGFAAPIQHGADTVRTWKGESVLVTDQAAAVDLLRRELTGHEVVLVKASRYRTRDVAHVLRDGAGEATA